MCHVLNEGMRDL